MAPRKALGLSTDPAKSLTGLYGTLSLQPLRTSEEFSKLYEPSLNAVRGDDLVTKLKWDLERHHGAEWFKVFFYGSRGSGKSTEMSRLLASVDGSYRGVRVDVRQSLNATAFQPHEIILAIAIRIAEETWQVLRDTEAEAELDSDVLSRIDAWFLETDYSTTSIFEKGSDRKVEAKTALDLLGKFVSLGASVTGSLKTNYSINQTTRDKRKAHYTDLKDAANSLFEKCNELLGAATGTNMEWLVVLEDFDKVTPLPVLNELLIENSHIFRDLETHLICNLPFGAFSGHGREELEMPLRRMYDTPVYDERLEPHKEGRLALRGALARRVDESIFASDQLERLIVASGGSLRQLFELVSDAGEQAHYRRTKCEIADPDAGPIEAVDVDYAINKQRQDFRNALGEDLTGKSTVLKVDKINRIKSIYTGEPSHAISDAVLNELLVTKVVQSLNGRGRYVVHPIVVDLMCDDCILDSEGKRVKGGLI